MIIFHSRESLTPIVAGLLHLEQVDPLAGPEPALPAALPHRTAGLACLGIDPAGRSIYALGCAGPARVAAHAFHGVAALGGVAPGSYRLIAIEADPPWLDLAARLARSLRLGWVAARLERSLLARRWSACLRAARQGREPGLQPGADRLHWDLPAASQEAP